MPYLSPYLSTGRAVVLQMMPVWDEPKKRTSPSGQSNTMYGKIAHVHELRN